MIKRQFAINRGYGSQSVINRGLRYLIVSGLAWLVLAVDRALVLLLTLHLDVEGALFSEISHVHVHKRLSESNETLAREGIRRV